MCSPTYCTLAPTRQRRPFNHQTVTLADVATPSPLDDPDIVYGAPNDGFRCLVQFGTIWPIVSPCPSVGRRSVRWQLAAHTKLLTLGRFLRPSVLAYSL